MSDWRDDELDEWESQERARPGGEGVRVIGEDGQPAAPRFPLPGEEGPTWSASNEVDPPRPADTGSTQLPHWTEPPTGQVPRIRREGSADDDFEPWSQMTGPGTPRFRTDAGDWSEGDFGSGELAKDDSTAIGALADDTGGSDYEEEFYGAPPRRSRRRGRGRRGRGGGGPDEPVEPPPGPGGLEASGTHEAVEYEQEEWEAEPSPVDLTRRVMTAAVLAVVAVIAFAIGRSAVMLLVTLIVGICAFELYEAFRRAGYHTATIIGLLGCVAIVPIAFDQGERAFPLVMLLVVVFSLLWYLFEVVHARPTVNVALTLFVFGYVGVLGAFAALLLAPDPGGTGLLLGVVICAIGSDVVGYFVGSRLGRTALMPRVSPNKTLEGLVAGAITALVLGGIVGGILHPWADEGVGAGLALGLVVAITAPLGDLAESMLKRDLGVKDLGAFLPGHGGFLDRFDAILFTLPASYYLALQIFSG